MNRDRIEAAMEGYDLDASGLSYDAWMDARVSAVEALIREAVDEALEAAAQHLQGEAEREPTGSRRIHYSQAATIVRSHKGGTA